MIGEEENKNNSNNNSNQRNDRLIEKSKVAFQAEYDAIAAKIANENNSRRKLVNNDDDHVQSLEDKLARKNAAILAASSHNNGGTETTSQQPTHTAELMNLEEAIAMNCNVASYHNQKTYTEELINLEEQVATNNNHSTGAYVTEVNRQLQSLDERIAMKLASASMPPQQKPSANNSSTFHNNVVNEPVPGSSMGNDRNYHQELDLLDQRIATKLASGSMPPHQQQSGSTRGIVVDESRDRNLQELDLLDQRIAMKLASGSIPPQRQLSSRSNGDVMNGSIAGSNHHQELALLDQRIEMKLASGSIPPPQQQSGSTNSNVMEESLDRNLQELDLLDQRIERKLASGSLPPQQQQAGSTTSNVMDEAVDGNLQELDLLDERIATKLASGSMRQVTSPARGGSARSLFSAATGSRNSRSNVHRSNSNQSLTSESTRPQDSKLSAFRSNSATSINSEATSVRPQDSKLSASQSASGRSLNSSARRVGAFAVPSLPPLRHPGTAPNVIRVGGKDNDDNILKDGLDHVEYDDDDKLAVALPVLPEEEYDEDNDGRFLPAAIEYDPDQKAAQIQKSKSRMLLYVVIIVIVAICLIVVGVVIAMTSNNNSNNVPEAAVNPREQIGIKEFILSQIGTEAITDDNDKKNPYSQALDWITYIDPLQLTIDAPNFLQRYFVAFFYYVTSIKREWEFCAQPPSNSNLTDDANTTYVCRVAQDCVPRTGCSSYKKQQIAWLSSDTECDWAGVRCDRGGNIVGLELRGMNITGSLMFNVTLFPFLNKLDVGDGELMGTIPSTINNQWKHLTSFLLDTNKLSGTIPIELWNHRNIVFFQASSNSLTGSLPSAADLYAGKNFITLDIGNNNMNGNITSSIASEANNIQYLYLDGNNFTSTIPSEIFVLPQLYKLALDSNQLTGRIPTMINLPALIGLRLNSNKLIGPIPDSIYNVTTLAQLFLSNNQLTGTISSMISNLAGLGDLDLDLNQFSSTIPSEIGALTGLNLVKFEGNYFNGTIPIELCDLRQQALIVLSADCLSSSDTIAGTTIACPEHCCTVCCDQSGKQCLSM